MKTIFESERIRFVAVTEELLPAYLEMINDIDRVARLIGSTKPYTEEQERAFVRQKLESGAPIFSMLEKAGGAFIGNIELMDVAHGAGELGIAITAQKQNMGYGYEAIQRMLEYGFQTLHLSRIYLNVFPNNARAIHVYRKCGFSEYAQTERGISMEIIRTNT